MMRKIQKMQMAVAIIILALMSANHAVAQTTNEDDAYNESVQLWAKQHQDFAHHIATDAHSINENFKTRVDTGFCSIQTSSDGLLRIYSWDSREGGTMIDWDNIIQYQSGGKVYTHQQSLASLVNPTKNQEGEMDAGSNIDTLFTMKCNDGRTVYLIEEYFRASSQDGTNWLTPVTIQNGKLVEVKDFFEKRKVPSKDYNIPDWYFRANNGEGWKWLVTYDEPSHDLYFFTTNSNGCITDQYDIYHFNGQTMSYKGRDGGYWLHSSIRKFKELTSLFETRSHRIRVDLMPDGQYRYVSWKRGQLMSTKPDIILYTRVKNKANRTLTFMGQEGYTYKVSLSDSPVSDGLTIEHKGRKVVTEKKVNPYTDTH
jgi:hypothetical protein